MNALRFGVIDGGDEHFAKAAEIRRKVFVEEQHVPIEEEWDGLDETALHILAWDNDDVVGVLRFYNDAGWLHIGRVAVLFEYRGQGIGEQLMRHCLATAKQSGYTRSFLSAQTDKIRFYARFGYVPTGPIFMEAGIPHQRMELMLNDPEA